jgi:hypothetical protein
VVFLRPAFGHTGLKAIVAVGDTAVEPILVDDGLDPGHFGDLMDQGLGVIASESMATAATGGRFAVERLADLLGRHQAPARLAMPSLAAVLLPSGGAGGLRFIPIGSDERGLDELVELSLSRFS